MKRALLTGVGHPGQVGEAVAARLVADGFEVILVDRSAENAEARASDIRRSKGVATAFGCDLADPESVDGLFRGISAGNTNELSAVVHMAGGFAATGPVAETA